MKEKPVLYLEPSFWRRLLDRDSAERRRATYTFLVRVARRCRLRVSRMVRAEIVAVRDLELRRQLTRKMNKERLRAITAGSVVDRRADELIEAGCVGPSDLADAYHIAYAICGSCDYLVTWDTSDLARPWTQQRVTEYCRRNNLKELRIGTPIEVGERWLGVRIR